MALLPIGDRDTSRYFVRGSVSVLERSRLAGEGETDGLPWRGVREGSGEGSGDGFRFDARYSV